MREYASMKIQSGKRFDVPAPSEEDFDRVLRKVVANYPKSESPYLDYIPNDEILDVLDSLNDTSGPGVPFAYFCTTKKDVKKLFRNEVIEIVQYRLELYRNTDLTTLSPVELVQLGATDPVRVFIKNEPHSVDKIEEGRLRIIMSVSCITEILEVLVCGFQNDVELENWLTCPSKPGVGLSSDEQLEKFYGSLQFVLDSIGFSDASGWDWCVQQWHYDIELRARCLLNGSSIGSVFHRVLKNLLHCMSNSVYMLSSGHMYTFPFQGVMKSGSRLTSSTNSRMRIMSAYMIGAEFAAAMGDDCLETYQEDAKEKYLKIGVRLKFNQPCVNGVFEFCSHLFQPGQIAIPVNWVKTTYKLVNQKYSDMFLLQFRDQMRNSPKLPFLLRCVSQCGWVGDKSAILNDKFKN